MRPADLRALQTRALHEHDLALFDAITIEKMLGDGEMISDPILGACRRWRLYDCPACGQLRHYGPDASLYAAAKANGACWECWGSDYAAALSRLRRAERLTTGGWLQRRAERYAPDSPERDRYRALYRRFDARARRIRAALARAEGGLTMHTTNHHRPTARAQREAV